MTTAHHFYNFADQVKPVELDSYYWLNGQRLSRAFCRALHASLADLLDVVMAVYAADRRSSRNYSRAAAGHRNISIRIGVRNPGLWSSAEVVQKTPGTVVLVEWRRMGPSICAAPSGTLTRGNGELSIPDATQSSRHRIPVQWGP